MPFSAKFDYIHLDTCSRVQEARCCLLLQMVDWLENSSELTNSMLGFKGTGLTPRFLIMERERATFLSDDGSTLCPASPCSPCSQM